MSKRTKNRIWEAIVDSLVACVTMLVSMWAKRLAKGIRRKVYGKRRVRRRRYARA